MDTQKIIAVVFGFYTLLIVLYFFYKIHKGLNHFLKAILNIKKAHTLSELMQIQEKLNSFDASKIDQGKKHLDIFIKNFEKKHFY